MIWHAYSIYDPELESFGDKIFTGPLGPEEMAEQYRRGYVKAPENEKAFMQGKQAIYLGTFDDLTGKFAQPTNLKIIFEFKTEKIEEKEIVAAEEEKDA